MRHERRQSLRDLWLELDAEERRFLRRSAALCLGLPLLVVLLDLGGLVWILVRWLLWFGLPAFVCARIVAEWLDGEPLARSLLRRVAPDVPSAVLGSDAATRRIPVVTLGLVVLNVVVHAAGADVDAFALDAGRPSTWAWANLSAMFLHGDAAHLWGNMIFLWVFGAPVEARLSRGAYLGLYLAAGSAANALWLVVELGSSGTPASTLGASGAISGIAGLFMARCYFSRVTIGVPLFGPLGALLPLLLRVRVHAMLLLGLFFLFDLHGARSALAEPGVSINFVAHLGGFLLGCWIGYRGGYFHDGLREALVREATALVSEDLGASERAREKLLRREPEHVEAWLARARAGSRALRGERARAAYETAIRLLLERDLVRAADVFAEYFRRYCAPLAPSQLLALAPVLERRGEWLLASQALELSSHAPDLPATEHQRLLLCQVRLLAANQQHEAALEICERFLREHPTSPDRAAVLEQRRKLDEAAGRG